MSSEKPTNPVSDRLTRSSAVTISIAIAAVLGFVIATVNGLYTIITAISKAQHSPTVKLTSVSLLRESREVNTNDFLGYTSETPLENIEEGFFNFDPKATWSVPYMHAQVVFTNPTDQPVSILDCALKVRFGADSRWHRSHAYAPINSKKTVRPGGPIINLSARESKKYDFAFYFLPVPDLREVWSGERQSGTLVITYIDDRGKTGATEIRKFSASDLLK